MTDFEWFQLAQFIVMTAAALLLWSLRGAFAGGSLIARLEILERRMDRAGQLSSDLTDEVQAFPDRWRTDCVTRREFDIIRVGHDQHFQRNEEDHKAIWMAVNHLYRRKEDD